jgi:hypothetical protein
MALSNPLRGERGAGSVGTPLPNMEVQLVGEIVPSHLGQGVAGGLQTAFAPSAGGCTSAQCDGKDSQVRGRGTVSIRGWR